MGASKVGVSRVVALGAVTLLKKDAKMRPLKMLCHPCSCDRNLSLARIFLRAITIPPFHDFYFNATITRNG